MPSHDDDDLGIINSNSIYTQEDLDKIIISDLTVW